MYVASLVLTIFSLVHAAQKHDKVLQVGDVLPEKPYVECKGDIVTCPVIVEIPDGKKLTTYDKVEMTFSRSNNDEKTILIGLFNKEYPYTTRSFFENAANKNYDMCPMHRVIEQFMAQGGDFTKKNGTGGEGYFSKKFADEKDQNPATPPVLHYGKGMVSMANAGPNTNGSQFFITFVKTAWLDNIHTVFGYVIQDKDNALKWLETHGPSDAAKGEPIYIKTAKAISVNPESTPYKEVIKIAS